MNLLTLFVNTDFFKSCFDLVHFCRTNDRNRQSINRCVFDGNYFPFWARKCRCAECIIANNKMEKKSHTSSKSGYGHLRPSEKYLSQTRDGYNCDLKAKERLAADQSKPGNGNSMAWWSGKEPFMTTSHERRPMYKQNKGEHLPSNLFGHKPPAQFATTPPDANKAGSPTQLLNPEKVKSNEVATNDHWMGARFGYSNKLNYEKQQDLTSIHPANPVRHYQDPRLRNLGKSDSIYKGHSNFEAGSKLQGTDGYRRPVEQKGTNGYREENEPSFQQNTKLTTWWNASSMSLCSDTAHAPNNYQVRGGAPAMRINRGNAKSSEEWKFPAWEGHMQTLPERSTDFGINYALFQGTHSHNSILQNHQSMPSNAKTRRNSDEAGINLSYLSVEPVTSAKKRKVATDYTPDQLQKMASRRKREPGDASSHQSTNLPKRNQELTINNEKEFKDFQNTKNSESCAREERIRNLKVLLEKQERALEAIRFQRKAFFIAEKDDNNITSNETRAAKSSDQDHIATIAESPCSGEVFSLAEKRRWLKNWIEEDDVEHRYHEIGKWKQIYDTREAKSVEEEDENLSNAEYTAVEGLVRLSKD